MESYFVIYPKIRPGLTQFAQALWGPECDLTGNIMDWGDCTVEYGSYRIDFDRMETDYVCWRVKSATVGLAYQAAIVLANLADGQAYFEATGAGRPIN